MPPTGSMTGAEIEALLRSGGGIAYRFGVTNYCASRGDAVACARALDPQGVPGGVLLAGMALATNVPHDRDKYYTSASSLECDAAARQAMIIATQLYLNSVARGANDSAGVHGGDLTAAALAAANTGASRCRLEEVGRIVSAGEVNL